MSKVFVIIRTIGERTTDDCIKAVADRFGNDYKVLSMIKPLEAASKETILTGALLDNKFEWIFAVDADIILSQSREWYEAYADKMKVEFKDRLFSFTGYINCTERGFIGGMHMFRTKYCAEVLEKVNQVDFSYKPGREESEMCWWVRDKMSLGTVEGIDKKSFGKHFLNNF